MRKVQDVSSRTKQPALVITYGNTTCKSRPLDRDVIVLGRSRSCDVALVSPEVASVHCVVVRTPAGWRLRDCTGRGGTRLNGRAIQDELLCDGDVVQVGNFSFEAQLPAVRKTKSLGQVPAALMQRLQRLSRSRNNLVRLALRLRRRARKAVAAPPTLAELQQQAEVLRGLQHDCAARREEYDKRLAELEKAEQEVCDTRDALQREWTERMVHLDRAEHDLARREAESEARIRAAWEECQERCRQAEQARVEVVPVPPSDEARRLDLRRRELDHYAHHLRRLQQKLQERKPAANPEPHDAEELEDLRADVEALTARLREQEEQLTDLWAQAAEAEQLRGQVRSLERAVEEREAAVEQMKRQLTQGAGRASLENSGSYERELNGYRQELEQERQDLEEQYRQLQLRQAELEEAAREAEVQMSRERAVIAQERAALNRLRDEVRVARDRDQREGSLRDRLAHIRQLKEGLALDGPGTEPSTQLRR
jgi:chromosome segregation ATPase